MLTPSTYRRPREAVLRRGVAAGRSVEHRAVGPGRSAGDWGGGAGGPAAATPSSANAAAAAVSTAGRTLYWLLVVRRMLCIDYGLSLCVEDLFRNELFCADERRCSGSTCG